MHAFAASAPGLENCRYADVPEPTPKEGENRVQLEDSAAFEELAAGNAFGKTVLTR